MDIALITGASGGIGQAIARRLATDGYSLYLHYNTGEDNINKMVSELRDRHPKQIFEAVQADLTQKSGVFHLLEQIRDPLDCVVYNSGKSSVSLMTEVTENELDDNVQLHLTSPFLLIQKLLPPMINNQSGKIVFISSIWGLTGASMEVLYSMVKGGQNSFIKALAKEVAPSGISVNAVAPGAVDTQMMADFSEEDLEFIKEDIPMGRLGHPDEVADLVGFLVSPQADYINGQVVSINGAWHC
ncbi:3-oxoacyl-[acyl-carrier protein] reductase [Scopulibacillus darangshiensis]|uniref:3-oxoacyl-[acyl-carrier protein] reductase n=1 Tax=Scopulibacillus darangshiensis TaxID=442528 RepID=A0A4R2P7L8_9BACL|nr:SDR family oxidoreductase [Scopulibacillus darangshiensis]TCP30268.1 3-oxoacyl-[acyl-carrier protein] reductase [Scopulibacillus darangshiensis]